MRRVVIGLLATHEQTKHYMARRTQEGRSKPEIIRCLKRYVSRDLGWRRATRISESLRHGHDGIKAITWKRLSTS